MWKRISLAALLLVLGVAAFVFWPEPVRLEGTDTNGADYDVRILRDEWAQVIHRFPDPDESDRQTIFFRHRHDNTTFGGTIEFADAQAGNTNHAAEMLDLRQGILASGRIHGQHDLVREVRVGFL